MKTVIVVLVGTSMEISCATIVKSRSRVFAAAIHARSHLAHWSFICIVIVRVWRPAARSYSAGLAGHVLKRYA